jgi:hypothetical protein
MFAASSDMFVNTNLKQILAFISGSFSLVSLLLIPVHNALLKASSDQTGICNTTADTLKVPATIRLIDLTLDETTVSDPSSSTSSSASTKPITTTTRKRSIKDLEQAKNDSASQAATLMIGELQRDLSVSKWDRNRYLFMSQCLLWSQRILQLVGTVISYVAGGLHIIPWLNFLAGAILTLAYALGPESQVCVSQSLTATKCFNHCSDALTVDPSLRLPDTSQYEDDTSEEEDVVEQKKDSSSSSLQLTTTQPITIKTKD